MLTLFVMNYGGIVTRLIAYFSFPQITNLNNLHNYCSKSVTSFLLKLNFLKKLVQPRNNYVLHLVHGTIYGCRNVVAVPHKIRNLAYMFCNM